MCIEFIWRKNMNIIMTYEVGLLLQNTFQYSMLHVEMSWGENKKEREREEYRDWVRERDKLGNV